MLAKKNRLTKREDFSLVYARGAYAMSDSVAIKYLPSGNAQTRIGFSVGKNFSKKATVRNRIKRLLRQASRMHIESLKPGFDVVIMPKPDFKPIEFKKIVEILKQIFAKAKLFK
jgi:ribonuclease P protein component